MHIMQNVCMNLCDVRRLFRRIRRIGVNFPHNYLCDAVAAVAGAGFVGGRSLLFGAGFLLANHHTAHNQRNGAQHGKMDGGGVAAATAAHASEFIFCVHDPSPFYDLAFSIACKSDFMILFSNLPKDTCVTVSYENFHKFRGTVFPC